MHFDEGDMVRVAWIKPNGEETQRVAIFRGVGNIPNSGMQLEFENPDTDLYWGIPLRLEPIMEGT